MALGDTAGGWGWSRGREDLTLRDSSSRMPAPGQSNLVFVPIAPDGLLGGVGRREPIPCDLYNTLKIGRSCSQGIDFIFVSG